jgi:hypothetical protein
VAGNLIRNEKVINSSWKEIDKIKNYLYIMDVLSASYPTMFLMLNHVIKGTLARM